MVNTDYLHSKWVKMNISSTDEDEKQVRISASLKLSCLKDIEDFKTEKGLFGGRSDFVLAALRYYYYSRIGLADSYLAKLDDGLSSSQKMNQLKKLISKDVNDNINSYETFYNGSEKQQVLISVSKYMDDCINDLAILSGKKTSDIIIAAIASYRIELLEKMHLRDEFIKAVNKL